MRSGPTSRFGRYAMHSSRSVMFSVYRPEDSFRGMAELAERQGGESEETERAVARHTEDKT